jgi:hypothetical protein
LRSVSERREEFVQGFGVDDRVERFDVGLVGLPFGVRGSDDGLRDLLAVPYVIGCRLSIM